jgi:endonuclease/exonuclease/phosphatase (EEP) superfamily protein YafD
LLVVAGLATLTVPALLAWTATVEESVRPGSSEIKIVSLNTWHANTGLDRLQAYLEHEDADLVLLVEFGPPKFALIDRLKGRYPFAAGCAQSWDCSVEVLSKHPIASAMAGRREAFDGPPRMVVGFGAGARPLTVIATHMMRPIDGPNGHLKEMRRVAGIARGAPGPVIVAGDFNATSWSHSFRVFREESGLVHMGRYLPSWPSQSRGLPPQLNIDHLWVSEDLAVSDVHLGPDVGSDHRPLVAIVKLPEGFAW